MTEAHAPRRHKDAMQASTIKYFGWSSLAVTSPQGIVLFDPFYREYCGVQWFDANDLCPADFICVTHGHEEHFLDVPELAERTGATVLGPNAVIRFLRRRNGLKSEHLQALEAGQSARLQGFQVDAFSWQHRDVNLVKLMLKGVFTFKFSLFGWALHSMTKAPFMAPYTGYRLTLADGTTVLNYNEGFNSKMTDAEIEALGQDAPTDVLLGGMQLDFMPQLARGVRALQPRLILLYPPHDKLHAAWGVPTAPWSSFVEAAQQAAPKATVVALQPGMEVNLADGSVSQFGRISARIRTL